MTRSRAVGLVLACVVLRAAVSARPAVTATDAQGEAAGRVLLGELNCTACHAATGKQASWLSPKMAPRLTGIGARASGEWLQRYLAAPHVTMPGTSMPDVLQLRTPADRAAGAEALTHYLLSMAPVTFSRVMPDRAAAARGESLYHRVGCVACHAPRNTTTDTMPVSPLPRIVEKWSLDGLRQFLRDPLASRPSGRMPAMPLSDIEAADVAHYLLRETHVRSPLEVAQYRGRIRSLGELDSAELSRTGPSAGFTLDAMGRERGYALRFTGWLRVDQPGDYAFHLNATGASRLSVRERWLLGEDSWERESVNGTSTLRLTAGWHPLIVDYVQRGSKDPALKVEWEGPGVGREVIPASRLRSEPAEVKEPAAFVVDAAKAAEGRRLYATLACAACHEAKAPVHVQPPLAALRITRGCLAEQPSGQAPDYHLDGSQRAALQQALTSLNRTDLSAPTPQQRVAHTMASFNCRVCHVRDGAGGVAPARDAFFTSNGEDLGDEGRLPPRLDEVGDRLRPTWLNRVLTEGASVRPYLDTRMPQFGTANVGHLAALFVALDRHAQPVRSTPDARSVQLEAGRAIAGTDGLSCIACHRFNRQPAQALSVIDLATTTERLNQDWFGRFLLDPNRVHPGTRMPALWPRGVSSLPSVLGGDTQRQHAALWTYLSGGTRAKFPEGLNRQNVELIVGGDPVVYRGKLWEAGFRAIAVGYPGQLNAAFDAEEMRLALLWRGRFLNAGPHWTVQGMGQIRPLESNVVVFPHGPALAVLTDADAPWPAEAGKPAGLQFRGSQLDAQQRPTLLYALGAVSVEDFMSPVETAGKTGLRRTLTLTGPLPDGLYFRVAAGRITPGLENTWRLDGALTIRVTGGGKAFTRGAGDRRELLVPMRFALGPQQLEIEYVW
jgi:mono/diheme cytochrome c family protein